MQYHTAKEFEKYKYVRYTTTDLHGVARHGLVPARHCTLEGLSKPTLAMPLALNGVLPEIPHSGGKLDIPAKIMGNSTWKPDVSTLHPVTWCRADGIGQVLCESYWNSGQPHKAHPRYIARTQLKRLEDLGYSLMTAFEYEWILFNRETKRPVFEQMVNYCSSVETGKWEKLLMEIDTKLYAAGVDVESIELEYAGGQFELPLVPQFGIKGADNAFIYRNGIKELCDEKGYIATFMSRADPEGSIGSGCHFNHSLWSLDRKENVFYDPERDPTMSKIMEHWIAGLLKHLPSLCAVSLPTFNCYRRINRPILPCHADWGIDDRYKAVRVKVGTQESTYVENRLPGACCNPYLVFAGVIMAGIDGITKKLELPSEIVQHDSKLPTDLGEALKRFKADKLLVEHFGDDFIEWLDFAKRNELDICHKDNLTFEQERNIFWKLI